MQFFTRRWTYFQQQMTISRTGNFSFHVGDKQVVALSGENTRKIFFDNKSLQFNEAYAAMIGGTPDVNTGSEEKESFSAYVNRNLLGLIKGPVLAKGLPQMLADVRQALDKVATKSETDPFDSIYRIVFHLTIRTVGCVEIADDPVLREKTLGLYETLERTASAINVMYSWLPTPSKMLRMYAGTRLYMIVQKIIDARRREDRREDDPLQTLIDHGDSTIRIVAFVLNVLFAGILNSGVNAACIAMYIAADPHWCELVVDEVRSVADRYNADVTVPLRDRLMSVPFAAWETEFPVIDACLRETIRLQLSGTFFRRNDTGASIPLDKEAKEVIPHGAYATYPIGDTHYNPAIYANPDQWDPSRYSPERAEDKKQHHAFVGWGVSRHPCLGMKFAKLENNIIIAMFVAYFENLELLGQDGKVRDAPPCNRNNLSTRRPDERVMLQYTLRKD
jgi:cytochrome P450